MLTLLHFKKNMPYNEGGVGEGGREMECLYRNVRGVVWYLTVSNIWLLQ